MRPILLCSLVLSLPAAAQSVSLIAAAPVAVTTQLGGQTQTSIVPGGVVALPSVTTASVPASLGGNCDASLAWSSTVSPLLLLVECRQTIASELAIGSVQASIGLGDWFVVLSSPQSVVVELSVRHQGITPVGAVSQSLEVDVGDDGHVEYSLAAGGEWGSNVTLGPSPLVIRVHGDLSAIGPAAAQSVLVITARPQAGIVSTQAILGCDGLTQLTAWPRFDGDLLLHRYGAFPTVALSVVVIGLGVQPVVLAPATPFPCVLLPTADLLFFVPGQDLTLPLPPAVRPVTFVAQSVQVDSFGLRTSNALLVSAY